MVCEMRTEFMLEEVEVAVLLLLTAFIVRINYDRYVGRLMDFFYDAGSLSLVWYPPAP
jgi:hypothetical protein